MSSKPKFSKLKLPKTSRLKTNSQISNFFSTSNNEDNLSLLSELPKTSSELLENSNETSTNSCSTNDIILVVSDEDDTIQSIPNEPSNTKYDLVKEELRKTITKFDSKTEQISRNTVISKFLTNDDDFENPPVKTITKSKKVTNSKSSKSRSIPKRKRQTTIKNAFVKNEEVFSELMAQHSIAEDINPDELQMALAMSLSEATASGICQDEDSKESLLCFSGNTNKLRDRLQEYGFKTSSNSGDYDIAYFLPAKRKAKWANKFTALTLRNPQRQNEKLNNKIEKILNQNCVRNKSNEINETKNNFLISSNYLNKLKTENCTIKLNFEDFSQNNCIERFYVDELFEPCLAAAGHLMKDLNEIPGRDLSPKKNNIEHKIENNVYENFEYEETCHQESKQKKSNETIAKNQNFKTLDMTNSLNSNDINLKLIASENSKIKMSNNLIMRLEIEDILLSPQPKKSKIETEPEPEQIINKLNDENNENHCSSPDLFADFEWNISKEKLTEDEFIYQTYSNSLGLETNSETKITTFENFSSDDGNTHGVDVKNAEAGSTKINHSKNISNIKTFLATSIVDEQLIDLTQDIENEVDSNLTPLRKSFENYEHIANSCSQINDSIDDCIILSDDEVNYSIKIANKTNYNKNIDLTLNSSSETERGTNYDENNMKNFSFINLIEDNKNVNLCINKNMNLENNSMELSGENENDELTTNSFKSQSSSNLSSPTKITLTQNYYDDIHNNSFSEFISPTKITPTKLFRNQRFSPSETVTCNSSRKLNFVPAADSFWNKSIQVDSEDDDTSFDLTKLRTKYGIKEIENKRKTINCRKTLSESFILPPINGSNEDVLKLKHFSRSIKFKEFIEPTSDDEYFSDVDEIDKLVHGSEFKTSIFNKPKPQGIHQLLTADVKTSPISSTSNSSINEEPREISNNGRIYLVRTRDIHEKPDYKRMDSPTRLKELYKYGLKPLKRKQAVIMLEYIYNQTHPTIIKNNSPQKTFEIFTEQNRELINKQNNIINCEYEKNNQINNNKFDNYKLQDCFGTKLMEDDGFILGGNNDGIVIFQTNISKKISTALLPLHVAWYNLIKSNCNLKETILHYEPIDLQEIYLFFKNIGYRYDPKDIKKFFDNHCIIFRYDLNQDPTSNRHIRKKKSFTLSQKNKQVNFDWML